MSRSRRGRRHPLAVVDQRLFDAVSHAHSPWLDATMPTLTRAADRSRLWLLVGAAMYASRNRRLARAAGRGLASVAVSSLLVNQLGKRVFPRVRP